MTGISRTDDKHLTLKMRNKNGQIHHPDDPPGKTGLEKPRDHIPPISAHNNDPALFSKQVAEQLVGCIPFQKDELYIVVMRLQPLLHLELILDGGSIILAHIDDRYFLVSELREKRRPLLNCINR